MSRSAASGSRVAAPPMKGAYWPEWASDSFPPQNIDTSMFTHIYYAFLIPKNSAYEFDTSKKTHPLLRNFVSALRDKKPSIKTLFSIGGYRENNELFVAMASSEASRQKFIASAMAVARRFGFDGIDFDWEYPDRPKDMVNMGHLFKEWRAELSREAQSTSRPPLLLTAAVYFAVDIKFKGVSYPADSIGSNLDWINVMCYDYTGSWEPKATGVHAALHNPNSNVSTSSGLDSWIKAGVPRNKLVMGLPLYGKTWILQDPSQNRIGAPAVGKGPGEGGALTYSEVEDFNRNNNATVVFDEDVGAVYSFSGTTWIGYDDPRSAKVKIEFAKSRCLGGYFFWNVTGDDNWNISRQALEAWDN